MASLLTNLTNALRADRMRRDLEGEVDEILKDLRYNLGWDIASKIGPGDYTVKEYRGVIPSDRWRDRWQMPTRAYGGVIWDERHNLRDLLKYGSWTSVFLIEFDANVNPETGKIDRTSERVVIRSGYDYKKALNSYAEAHPQRFGDYIPGSSSVWMPDGTFTLNLEH